MQNGYGFRVLATTAGLCLAKEACQALRRPDLLMEMDIQTHKDGELRLEIKGNVRGAEIYLFASGQQPDRNLIELLWALDALRRSAVKRITVVLPYYPYSRSDKVEDEKREPLGAALVARLIERAGADQCLIMDPHNTSITGMFPQALCDRIHASRILVPRLKQLLAGRDFVVASPDAGGGPRARKFAKRMGQSTIINFSKERVGPGQINPDSIQFQGDVKDKVVIFVDDMIDSAGTILGAVDVALDAGASAAIAVAPHAVLSDGAPERIAASRIEAVLTTNSISHDWSALPEKIVPVSIGPMLGHAIHCLHTGESLKELRTFDYDEAA
ncbi:MAG TPA: ribose-phosphate diphosphokinase [Candidatus Paceibacterota bacterium]|nr:ribose-phosphate diphosphokinase [Candidatus Paceibacterota bacterium]